MMTCQMLRPKFILVALVLVINCGQFIGASPLPDAEDVWNDTKAQTKNFADRVKNTFNNGPDPQDPTKMTTTEMVLIGVAAFLVFMFLLCCIGYCLCECIKELICCICCCGRN